MKPRAVGAVGEFWFDLNAHLSIVQNEQNSRVPGRWGAGRLMVVCMNEELSCVGCVYGIDPNSQPGHVYSPN